MTLNFRSSCPHFPDAVTRVPLLSKPAWMSVHHLYAWCQGRPEEGTGSPKMGVTGGYELLCRHWDLNLCLLEERPMPLPCCAISPVPHLNVRQEAGRTFFPLPLLLRVSREGIHCPFQKKQFHKILGPASGFQFWWRKHCLSPTSRKCHLPLLLIPASLCTAERTSEFLPLPFVFSYQLRSELSLTAKRRTQRGGENGKVRGILD